MSLSDEPLEPEARQGLQIADSCGGASSLACQSAGWLAQFDDMGYYG